MTRTLYCVAILLTMAMGGCLFPAVGKLTADDMELTIGKDRIGHFESKPLPSDNPAEDPFSTENNRWRIPPTHKESNAEIKERLYNHCQFWEN